jgi:hypothetical protein
MATGRNSGRGVVAEGGRLVADALESAAFGLAEAIAPPARDAPPAASAAGPSAADGAAPAADPLPPGAAAGDDDGLLRKLASAPARAAGDAASAVAASVVPAVVERLDVNALLAKVDVNALVARVDVDAVLDQVEPNRVLDRVDVDALVQRVDVGAVAAEALEAIDIGDLIQESTAGIASDTLEAIRVQAIRGDDVLARAVDWVLRRKRPRDTVLDRRGGP